MFDATFPVLKELFLITIELEADLTQTVRLACVRLNKFQEFLVATIDSIEVKNPARQFCAIRGAICIKSWIHTMQKFL